MVFEHLGLDFQRALLSKKVAIVGVGGLGSWTAELLARAGVGHLRLIDDDRVNLDNLHRQAMYSQADAAAGLAKVDAAARRLGELNSQVSVEPIGDRVGRDNIEGLLGGVDLVLDGTDNFASRFVINDYCIRQSLPWIFAGVVGAEAQTMTIIPPHTPCLRCISESPPPPCIDPSCRIAGVLGPAVSMIASIQAVEAVKVLSGNRAAASPYLLKIDLWRNALQRIDVAAACEGNDCPCCKGRQFDYLES